MESTVSAAPLYNSVITTVEARYKDPEGLVAADMFMGALVDLSYALHWFRYERRLLEVDLYAKEGLLLGAVSIPTTMKALPDALDEVVALVSENQGLGDVDPVKELSEGLLRPLDKHTKLMSGGRLDRFDTRIKGSLVGIGATLRVMEGDLTVRSVLDGGPAKLGGLVLGDIIARVDGVSTTNMPMSESIRRIRGERGTEVTLQVVRDGALLTFILSRAMVKIPDVHTKDLGDGVGYVKVDHFSRRTGESFETAVGKLRESGVLTRGLVLDLRRNSGGSMRQSTRVADQFVSQGVLVRTAGRNGKSVPGLTREIVATPSDSDILLPVVVLIDGKTASGAEIVAGALVSLERAVTIGADSFGKGTVQKVYNLSKTVRLKMTVAEYRLAQDQQVADVGIQADLLLGPVMFDDEMPRFVGWDPVDKVRPSLGYVWEERDGNEEQLSFPVSFAKAVALESRGGERSQTLEALRSVTSVWRGEQQDNIVSQMNTVNIDWSEDAGTGGLLHVETSIRATSSVADENGSLVSVDVTNLSEAAISKVVVTLSTDKPSRWNGVVIPIGRISSGAQGSGSTRVVIPGGVMGREDLVTATVHAAGFTSFVSAEEAITTQTTPSPVISVLGRLVGEGTQREVEIHVRNNGSLPLEKIELSFAAPGDLDIELIDRAVILPMILAGESSFASLKIEVKDNALITLPMLLNISSERYGSIARWETTLPVSGVQQTLKPPLITYTETGLSSPVGLHDLSVHVVDDSDIAHVMLYVNDEKTTWAGDSGAVVRLNTQVTLVPGLNLIVTVATDDQGLVTSQRLMIRGVPASP
jgi:carboxyl-terminal processing protease